MRRIAFDIDGVITDWEKFLKEKGKEFFKREIVNENASDLREMFNCTEKEYRAFWNKYLLYYCTKYPLREGFRELIEALHKNEEVEIFFITARVHADKQNILGKIMRTLVEKQLSEYGIDFDKDRIIYCSEKDTKEKICQRNHIDFFFEDNVENMKALEPYTNVICMNSSYNRDCIGEDIYHIDSFYEAKALMDKIWEQERTYIEREQTVLSGVPSQDKIWARKYSWRARQMPLPTEGIYEYMYNRNKDYANKIAIEYFGSKITYKELFAKIEQCSQAFYKKGVREGDRVTICMPNTPEAVIAFYALNRIGAVGCMMHPYSSEADIKQMINKTKSKMAIMIDFNYQKIDNILHETELQSVVMVSAKESMPQLKKRLYPLLQVKRRIEKCKIKLSVLPKKYFIKDPKSFEKITKKLAKAEKIEKEIINNNLFYKSEVSELYKTWSTFVQEGKDYDGQDLMVPYRKDRPAAILCTGGTTGRPKGAVLTNDNFNAMVHQYSVTAKNFVEEDKMLTIMPNFHGFGLCNCIHMPLCLGVTVQLVPQLTKFYKLVKKNKPNHIMGVPTLWANMVSDRRFQKILVPFFKYIVNGGDCLESIKNPLEQEINQFLSDHHANVKITKGYGLTEAVASVTFTFENSNEIGSIGVPLINTNIKIVKPGTEEEVSYGEEGEICVCGPTVMLGYYNDTIETDNVLKTHQDGKVWLHTGDIGHINEEGLLFYTQRLKRVIVRKGFNVYHRKIEKVIEKHPSVKSCSVVGVPNSYEGKVPVAVIVLKEETVVDDKIRTEIQQLCTKNLAHYEIPYKYFYKGKMPETMLGKIDFGLLEEEAIKEVARSEIQNKEKSKILRKGSSI